MKPWLGQTHENDQGFDKIKSKIKLQPIRIGRKQLLFL